MFDVIVIGAGPAGVIAALRAGDLGKKTALITRNDFGGMAANDGPIPVRALAHAARLLREARQLSQYGITVSEPVLDYAQLRNRIRTIVKDVRSHSFFRDQLNSLGVAIHEQVGDVRFKDEHTVETTSGLEFHGKKFILCTGGVSRELLVPGFALTATPTDALTLSSVPSSIIVIGGGATGIQVASIFRDFGSKVEIFQAGPRILPSEDEDISAAVTDYFQNSGIVIRENFGAIESFEKTAHGKIRMAFVKNGIKDSVDADCVVVAVGWVANTTCLNLNSVGVTLDARNFVQTNTYLQTTAPHIFAAGDVTGRLMLVPQAIQDGFVATTNAVLGNTLAREDQISPIGSFTNPEYAQVGLTEAKAREGHEITKTIVHFDSTTRNIIDGRTNGFCKLLVDNATYKILGCHVVGDRAVEIIQAAAIAMTAGMRVDKLARISFSFPTYVSVLGRAAASAARQLNLTMKWQALE